MKDIDNSLWPQRQPGPLTGLLGGRVEQYYALVDAVPIEGKWGAGDSAMWAELLSAKDTDVEVLMRYGKSNGWLDGQPAAITRKVGKGRITYIGAWLDPKTMDGAAKWMTDISGVKAALGDRARRSGCVSAIRRERCGVYPGQLRENDGDCKAAVDHE